MAAEWAPRDVRVNCAAPGAIETDGWSVYTEKARRRPALQTDDARRLLLDIAEACAYLAILARKFVTGETPTVNRG